MWQGSGRGFGLCRWRSSRWGWPTWWAAVPVCHAQQTASSGNKSWTDSITSPFKQGFDKLGHAFNPKPSARARTRKTTPSR